MFSALFLFVLLALAGCAEEKTVWKLSGPTMGTFYNITVVDVPAGVSQAELQSAVDAELVAVNQEMSTYIPDSELMRVNGGPVAEPIALSKNLALVIRDALEIYRNSGGAFDVTVGPLVNLWGFGPSPEPEAVPEAEQIDALREKIGSDALLLDGQVLTRSRPVQIDLSAIAKGHGVDRVADLLVQKGVHNFLVEVGGELRTAGVNPAGNIWRIGIERPSAGQVVQKPIAVSGKGIATSGDYRNYYERDGKRYSHTLDPRTGRPVEHHLASVTVIADTSALADGYATALNVMGAEAALKLAEELQLAVFLLVKTDSGFEERASSAFAPYLESQER
ncbi:FAD:protein FMN transferase [Microbulbifer agarilyticus]|uniref:FAD:protein FMN transferase n=1 Tax=Microbulbifer agarilyticus TaxID=260552 RepID=UPI001C941E23|nr:FAD:protein FMN transferase [Microbulbifer agarilyticus]MBY6212287.1 FAD:protein FMN transferase [Microbulbifer agarilyticus]